MDTPSYESVDIAKVFAFLRAMDDDDARLSAHLAAHGADPLHILPLRGLFTAYRLIARQASHITDLEQRVLTLEAERHT